MSVGIIKNIQASFWVVATEYQRILRQLKISYQTSEWLLSQNDITYLQIETIQLYFFIEKYSTTTFAIIFIVSSTFAIIFCSQELN